MRPRLPQGGTRASGSHRGMGGGGEGGGLGSTGEGAAEEEEEEEVEQMALTYFHPAPSCHSSSVFLSGARIQQEPLGAPPYFNYSQIPSECQCTRSTRLSPALSSHSLLNKTPEMWQRAMALDLEVSPLIPTSSITAVNCPSGCLRSSG
ncbi:unnamed protein product [Pleuronectes platessa]|uniref:Uncharacterized protein n=1 Tax=Pleuronectes platessa TaxID=8262 RepID=A0A9N7UDP7_PLEPL|nr:unnamed protein product [Pleuronectes platessa]